jgi:hypothetical protein
MAINFPDTPSPGQQYTDPASNSVWIYNSDYGVWISGSSSEINEIAEIANTALEQAQIAQNTATLAFARANTDVTSVNITPGTYGNTTLIPIVSVLANGRVSAISNSSTQVLTGVTIINDTATNADKFITFSTNSAGSFTSINVASSKLTFNPSTGVLSATNFSSTSDERLKMHVVTLENCLEQVSKLRGVSFKWKEDKSRALGLIAQEVEAIVPLAVNTNSEGIKGIQYTTLIPLLIESVKELNKKIDSLEKQLKDLK